MEKKILRILLKHYTKISYKGGIAKVIFDDEFENIAEEIAKSALSPVSGMLPNNFKQLPEKLQCKLVRKHTHAELVDGEKIVYEEQDLLDIIKYVSEVNYR